MNDASDLQKRIKELESELAEKDAHILQLELRYGQYFEVLEHMPSLAWIKNVKHKLTYLNPAFESAFGISRNDWMNKSGWDLFPEEQAAAMAENDQKVFDSGNGIVVMETVTTDRDFHYLSYKFPFNLPSGERFIAGISIDISAQIAAEQRLQSQIERYAELEANKNKFIALLSHDLRAPIANLISNAELALINDMKDADNFQAVLDRLLNKGENIIEVLDSLIQWYRDESAVLIQQSSVNVLRRIELVFDLYEKNISEKNLTVNIHADENLTASLFEAPFDTVLRNLISNAVKFSRDHSEISIQVNQGTDEIAIHIADQGQGIDTLKLNQLFENPWISSPGTANEKGFGFGLGIANELAKKYGWRLELVRTGEHGTEFCVRIPR